MADVRWEQISSEVIFEHPRLTLIENVVRLPDGNETQYLTYGHFNDYPTVIPRDAEGRILMIREHAFPVNEVLLQFPEGDAHDGESVEDATNRELHEETGLRARKITVLNYALREHRRNVTKNFTVLAEDLEEAGEIDGDPEEIGIEREWLTEDEVWSKIASGEIKQKNTLASWAIYQASKHKEEV